MELVKIYNLAMHELLRRREKESERAKEAKSEIAQNRLAIIDKEISYLHEEILKLEKA